MALTNTLAKSALTADAYGIGIKVSVALTDLVGLGAFTTGTLVLPIDGGGLPQGAIMQLVRIKHSQSVAGAGPITAATAQVVTANNNYGSAFDIFQAVSNANISTVQLTSGNIENWASVTPVNINIALTGGNASGLTAGAFTVWLRYVLLQ